MKTDKNEKLVKAIVDHCLEEGIVGSFGPTVTINKQRYRVSYEIKKIWKVQCNKCDGKGKVWEG